MLLVDLWWTMDCGWGHLSAFVSVVTNLCHQRLTAHITVPFVFPAALLLGFIVVWVTFTLLTSNGGLFWAGQARCGRCGRENHLGVKTPSRELQGLELASENIQPVGLRGCWGSIVHLYFSPQRVLPLPSALLAHFPLLVNI